jgi:hypothetical protein
MEVEVEDIVEWREGPELPMFTIIDSMQVRMDVPKLNRLQEEGMKGIIALR